MNQQQAHLVRRAARLVVDLVQGASEGKIDGDIGTDLIDTAAEILFGMLRAEDKILPHEEASIEAQAYNESHLTITLSDTRSDKYREIRVAI